MAITDILYTESDSLVLELTGSNSPIADVLFDNSVIEEIVGTNGPVTDIEFDPVAVTEIPNVLITDFAFI